MSFLRDVPRRPARLLAAGLAIVVVGVAITFSARTPHLPEWELATAPAPPEIERCAACHADVTESFARTPHWHTLHAGTSAAASEWDEKEFTTPSDGWTYRYEQSAGRLWLSSSAAPTPRPVDWLFGSGTHAQTPVTTWTNPQGERELLEHRVSRYPSGQLGLTLGRDTEERLPAGIAALGKWHTATETRHCFGCHASHLPQDAGPFSSSAIVPGVHCSRCHFGAAAHAEAMEQGVSHGIAMEKLSALPPLDQIHRCGECHRRADQFPLDELIPTNLGLIRFAPVGIFLSPCFQQQDATTSIGGERPRRLDCLTCHDPHQPAATSTEYYRQKCLECHGAEAPHRHCPSEPMTSDCLACHMPKVPVHPQLRFTDHWIRVRRNGDLEAK